MAIPNPGPGLVISYSFLWHGEYRDGREEGRKDRPAVIVLAVESSEGGAPRVRQHPGLDSQRSWIAVSEGNQFIWPGHDLRKRPRSDSYAYGILPGRFFDQVRAAFIQWVKSGEGLSTPRS